MRRVQSIGVVLALIAGQAVAQTVLEEVEKAASIPPEGVLSDAELGLPADPDAPKAAVLTAERGTGVVSEYDNDKIAGNGYVEPPLAARGKLPGTLPEGTPEADLGQPAGDAPKTADLAVSHAVDAVANVEDNDKIAGNPVLLADRIKLPQTPPEEVIERDLGQPAEGTPKVGEITVSARAEARLTSYDEDKISGNEPQPVPLTERVKVPSDVAPPADAADLGQPAADVPKTADLAASLAADAVPGLYDEDKIAGNEPPPGPLGALQKRPGTALEGLDAATLGTPATDAPKAAEVAVSLAADGSPPVDDNDKIAGNAYVQPPMSQRTKLPSVLPDPVVDADLGAPATDGPKAGVLTVSLAADSVPNIDDNDKIAGNPVISPPLTDRAKLASAILPPDDVTPEELGLPADEAAAAKTGAVVVSRLADAIPSVDDNDKLAGNLVVSPPLAERTKLAAAIVPAVGLTPDELGVPADAAVVKAEEIAVSRTAEAVTTVYDDDKIAENNVAEPFGSVDGMGDDFSAFDPGPPAELVAQILALLEDAAVRDAALAQARDRVAAPDTVTEPFMGFLTALLEQAAVRDALALEVARPFAEFGMSPDSTEVVARMTAEQLIGWGADEALLGMARLPVAEQRGFLADTLRVAGTLDPVQCAAYLDDVMDGTQIRQTELEAMATWTASEIETTLIRNAAAIVAELQDNPPHIDMSANDLDVTERMAGERMLAAIEGAENADALLLAYGNPDGADPADLCAVHKSNLGVVLAATGAEGDLLVRYVVSYGWIN